MFRSKDHPQGATLSLLKSLLKNQAAKHRTHTLNRALLATYPYTTTHAATKPGLYYERNQ